MLHPYSTTIIEIKVILEICTTFKGVPYGPALISYEDLNDKNLSFKGVGFFKEGKLTMTPFSCINEYGFKY
jgi:hypothetical protein